MKKKIKKVTPIKSDTLCRKCVYSFENYCGAHECENCERWRNINNSLLRCACNLINDGEKCEDFKRKIPSVQMGNFQYIPTKNRLDIVYNPKIKENEV